MVLDEAQIVRFSRQILLREIGGRGQERLLATTVGLRGDGVALTIAAAYLAAAGVTIGGGPGLVLIAPIDLRPEVAPESWCVAIGGDGPSGRLVHADASTCRACLCANLEALRAPPDELAPLLGTLAAIAVQRLILGLGERAGVASVQPDGAVDEAGWKRCITCG